MKKIFFRAIPILLCLSTFTACSEDESHYYSTYVPETPFWEQAHTTFLGLKGNVKGLIESQWEDVDGEAFEGNRTWTEFNTAGRITYYNPTGVEENRWIGMEMNSYRYLYDEQNRPTQAVVTSLGEAQCSYTLTYSNSSRYVPLPFALGALDFFLVRGLTAVEAEGIDFSGSLTENSVTYTTVTPGFRGDTETTVTYHYDEGTSYPTTCTVTESYGDEIISRELTQYEFAANGRLMARTLHLYEDDQELEINKQTYHSSLPLQLYTTEITNCENQERTQMLYTYDTQDRLTFITRTDPDGTTSEETYLYTQTDPTGNWTEGQFTWSSHVNLNHWDGTFRFTRTLIY